MAGLKVPDKSVLEDEALQPAVVVPEEKPASAAAATAAAEKVVAEAEAPTKRRSSKGSEPGALKEKDDADDDDEGEEAKQQSRHKKVEFNDKEEEVGATTHRLLVTRCTPLDDDSLEAIRDAGHNLGARFTTNIKHATHIVCLGAEPRRTLHVLQGIIRGVWVVSDKWVTESAAKGEFLPEGKYEVSGDLFSGAKKSRLAHSSGDAAGLFAGLSFVVGPNCLPPAGEIKSLIQLGGGTILLSNKGAAADFYVEGTAATERPKKKPKTLQLTCITDKDLLDCISKAYTAPTKAEAPKPDEAEPAAPAADPEPEPEPEPVHAMEEEEEDPAADKPKEKTKKTKKTTTKQPAAAEKTKKKDEEKTPEKKKHHHHHHKEDDSEEAPKKRKKAAKPVAIAAAAAPAKKKKDDDAKKKKASKAKAKTESESISEDSDTEPSN